jgi:hypothetical protein
VWWWRDSIRQAVERSPDEGARGRRFSVLYCTGQAVSQITTMRKEPPLAATARATWERERPKRSPPGIFRSESSAHVAASSARMRKLLTAQASAGLLLVRTMRAVSAYHQSFIVRGP